MLYSMELVSMLIKKKMQNTMEKQLINDTQMQKLITNFIYKKELALSLTKKAKTLYKIAADKGNEIVSYNNYIWIFSILDQQMKIMKKKLNILKRHLICDL